MERMSRMYPLFSHYVFQVIWYYATPAAVRTLATGGKLNRRLRGKQAAVSFVIDSDKG